jgi:hypothetical protein
MYIIIDIHPDDKKGLEGNRYYCGMLLLGVVKSSYSLTVDLAQAKQAALMVLESASHRYGNVVVDSFALGSFERYFVLDFSLWPITQGTLCIVELSAFQYYITSVTGELGTRTREILEAYHHHMLMIHILLHEF